MRLLYVMQIESIKKCKNIVIKYRHLISFSVQKIVYPGGAKRLPVMNFLENVNILILKTNCAFVEKNVFGSALFSFFRISNLQPSASFRKRKKERKIEFALGFLEPSFESHTVSFCSFLGIFIKVFN